MTTISRRWKHLAKRAVLSDPSSCVLFLCAPDRVGAMPATPLPAALMCPPVSASGDLSQMSIEDLMNLEVTSGAKKEEPLQRTAAAIFVITHE